MNYESLLNMKPLELLQWLITNYSVILPETVTTVGDMQKSSNILLRLAGNFQYLNALSSYAKLVTRDAKRNLSKQEYEDMVDKKEMIQNFTDLTKQNYNALSRAVTIYIHNSDELKMTGGT